MPNRSLAEILDLSCRDHHHLCPRQVLGARLGQAGLAALGFNQPPPGKRLLIIAETDGCFLDGISAATDCTPGHRTLRIEDYGKTAAVFVDTATHKAVRVAPWIDLRTRANTYAPDEPRRYFAQMEAYKIMPLEAMFTTSSVSLKGSIQAIVARPGVREICASCGEEIINERTFPQDGTLVCHTCAHGGYYLNLDETAYPFAQAQIS
jgi:formylmethanofuran dehydrogenase subunit E